MYIIAEYQFRERLIMRALLALLIPLALIGCKSDETISGYADAGAVWTLTELDGKPFSASATISFPTKGKVNGKAPCNTYASNQTKPMPWFEMGPVMSTKMACPELAAEQQFFNSLNAMTLAEVQGNILILSNDAGREMVFKTTP